MWQNQLYVRQAFGRAAVLWTDSDKGHQCATPSGILALCTAKDQLQVLGHVRLCFTTRTISLLFTFVNKDPLLYIVNVDKNIL